MTVFSARSITSELQEETVRKTVEDGMMANKTSCKTRPFLLLMSHRFQAVAPVSFGELMCYIYLTCLSLSGGGQSRARPYVNK